MIKTKLLNFCQEQVEFRHSKIKQTISNIEESLFEESKNSSGDKHETGRAMLQLDMENVGKQLFGVEKLIEIIEKIDINTASEYVRLGSLVYTDKFNYFISLSLGKCNVQGMDYLCVALNSPVGLLLSGKRIGESVTMNGSSFKIIGVR